MEPLSQKALTAIVQALDEYRYTVLKNSQNETLPVDDRYEYEQYLIQLDSVVDEVEEHYNAARKDNPSMLPFKELMKH